MPLTPETRLGPYDVIALLGAGGMGEVYRARDTRLDRDVAVKVLPQALARDRERILRFEREAKVLAGLNHPNIAAVYGFEEVDGKRLLIMELAEGETLAERLERGALAIADSIEIACGIAIALEAAHEKGVIHRDLKPANIKVSADGTVKVLDFGLAKAISGEASSMDIANSPTITLEHTRPGVVLGTAAYMSPEQARGRPLDKRTDIWSFGCILFECLSGCRPFQGDTATDLIAKILEREPDYAALPAQVPPPVQSLLRRCLAKDRSKRLRDMGDARIELENVLSNREWSMAASGMGRTPPRTSWKLFPAAAVLAALLFAAGYMGRWLGMRSAQSAASLATTTTPDPVVASFEQLTDVPGRQRDPCLSPDGKMLLYVSRDGDDLDIFLQRVGGANPINLTADCPFDDSAPAFSPDGNRIAFRSQREGGGLFVMGATGESPQRVSDSGFDPAWSPDGTHLVYATENVVNPYARDSISQLWILDLESRESRLLYRGDAVAPSYSPSGRLVSFWAAIAGIRDLWTIPVAGGEPQSITKDTHTDWNPFFSPDGRTLYFISDRNGRPNLWRVSMDQASGRALGPPSPVTSGTTPIDSASISSDGARIAFTAQSHSTEFLRFAFDPDAEQVVGEPTTLFASTDNLEQFDVSADGRRLAFRTGAPKEDLVIMEADGTGRRRLMDDVFRDRGPLWTRDASWLMFYSNRGGYYDLWRIRPDGTGLRRLTDSAGKEDATNPQLSPDGRTMVATLSTEGGQAMVIWSLDRPISEIAEPLPLPATRTPGFSPVRFCPKQRLLAGWSSAANRLRAVASIYELQTGEITILQSTDGRAFETWGMGSSDMDWIDEHRLLVWDDRRRSAVVWDTRTGSAREVPGIPGPCELRVIDNGRALIVSRQRTESDIWMLRLGDVAEQ